ncbi:macro domain-containing protein [Pseudosporangium ferrugineum]|uniref:Nucleoside phosphorylase n=1 Tax=Pseudosporangium ferrugineum TaxID=439699 RepID=A0A2T0RCK7_9ACTN|nr:macro domain-containing protein [Pseudosporangium ferrugineum]PRY18883.1 nucleoside phosphorylase [Pseudosporangium ferrugineum]
MQRRVDVVLLSALAVEHRAVLDVLRQVDPAARDEGGVVLASVAGRRVAAISLAAVGNSGSAAGAQQAIDRWHPADLVLIGIAAGVGTKEIRLGDVLVAETIVGYEPGRHDGQGLHRRPDVHRSSFALLAAARAVAAATRPQEGPQVHFGNVLAGEKVLADEAVFAELRRNWPTTVGAEMEGLGVATAAHRNGTGFLLVKGVSDFADRRKDDAWQDRAALAAAQFVTEVLNYRAVPAEESDPREPSRASAQRFALAGTGRFLTAVPGALYRTRGADIWVNSENTDMEMSRTTDFTISAIIRYWGARRSPSGKVVDDLIADELRRRVGRRSPVAPGTVVTTGAGELAGSHGVRRIIHVASVVGEPGAGFRQVRNIAACVANVLAEADRLATADPTLRVILMPLLGIGSGSGDLSATVVTMVDTAVSFLADHPRTRLDEIRLLGFNTEEWRALTTTMAGHPQLVHNDRPA